MIFDELAVRYDQFLSDKETLLKTFVVPEIKAQTFKAFGPIGMNSRQIGINSIHHLLLKPYRREPFSSFTRLTGFEFQCGNFRGDRLLHPGFSSADKIPVSAGLGSTPMTISG